MHKLVSVVLLFAALTLAGCKKEKNIIEQLSEGGKAGVGFGLSNNASISLDLIPGASASFDTTINAFSSLGPFGSDVKLTIQADNSVVDAYNTANGTSFAYAPADALTLPDITIPANSSKGSGALSINLATLLNSGTQFALGLKITGAQGGTSTVLEDHSQLVVIMNARNKYDGIYTVTGTMVDVTNSSLTGNYPETIALITTGANTCDWYNVDYSDYIHPILSGGAFSYYGNFSPQFQFNTTTDMVTAVTNYYGQPDASRGRSGKLDATGVNSFDPATKTLKVKYIMNEAAVGDRTYFDETFTYVGVR